MKFNKPLFITFEGVEGSGKSTQSVMLYEYLLSKNIKVVKTREIGGTIEAEKIRELIVHSELYPMTELMLVMAARYEHINKVIIPAIENGSWVICDRYVDSTASYQAEDSGLSIEDIYEIHDRLMRGTKSGYDKFGLMPNITFFMDIPPDIAVARAIVRGDVNKFDKRNIVFHKKVYDRYQRIIDLYKSRFVSINCVGKDSTKIHNEVVQHLLH